MSDPTPSTFGKNQTLDQKAVNDAGDKRNGVIKSVNSILVNEQKQRIGGIIGLLKKLTGILKGRDRKRLLGILNGNDRNLAGFLADIASGAIAVGGVFALNVMETTMRAILSHLTIPDNWVLNVVIKPLKVIGSDPRSHNDAIRKMAIDKDWPHILEWFDDEYGFTYEFENSRGKSDISKSAKNGAWKCGEYMLDKYYSELKDLKNYYNTIPTDKSSEREKIENTITEIEKHITLNLKNMITYAYGNLTTDEYKRLIDKYPVTPRDWGTTDDKYNMSCNFSGSDINVMAPFFEEHKPNATQEVASKSSILNPESNIKKTKFTKATGSKKAAMSKKNQQQGATDLLEEQIYKYADGYETDFEKKKYIVPRNKWVKEIYVCMTDKYKHNDFVLVNADLHERLEYDIMTAVKAALDQALANVMTGNIIGKLLGVVKNIKEVIYKTIGILEPLMFDPAKLIGFATEIDQELVLPQVPDLGENYGSVSDDVGEPPIIYEIKNYIDYIIGNLDIERSTHYTFVTYNFLNNYTLMLENEKDTGSYTEEEKSQITETIDKIKDYMTFLFGDQILVTDDLDYYINSLDLNTKQSIVAMTTKHTYSHLLEVNCNFDKNIFSDEEFLISFYGMVYPEQFQVITQDAAKVYVDNNSEYNIDKKTKVLTNIFYESKDIIKILTIQENIDLFSNNLKIIYGDTCLDESFNIDSFLYQLDETAKTNKIYQIINIYTDYVDNKTFSNEEDNIYILINLALRNIIRYFLSKYETSLESLALLTELQSKSTSGSGSGINDPTNFDFDINDVNKIMRITGVKDRLYVLSKDETPLVEYENDNLDDPWP